MKFEIVRYNLADSVSKIRFVGRWRKFIPGKSWIVRFPGVDSRVSGNQSKLPLVLKRERTRERNRERNRKRERE